MNNQPVEICLIPAAGKGSRWAPISGYLPKEMLPLLDKPVIEWVIDEAIASGCTEIVVVVNKQKKIIRDYLSKNKRLGKKAQIHFTYQKDSKGIASAMLSAREIIGNKPFTMALPDLPTLSKKPVLKQLIQAFSLTKGVTHITSFCNFPPDVLYLYGECLLNQRTDNLLDIVHFCPKNPDHSPHHPGNKLRMSGRYVFSPEIFSIIEASLAGDAQEINDTTILEEAIGAKHQVYGVAVVGHTYDTGTPSSYVRANTAFFKKNKNFLR